jgi:glycosyl transferase family 2
MIPVAPARFRDSLSVKKSGFAVAPPRPRDILRSRVQRARSRLRGGVHTLRFLLWPWLRAYRSGQALIHQCGATAARRGNGVVAVVPFYGNQSFLPAFLAHHRRLGIDAFVFLDLSAKGKLAARLARERDCSVWRPRGRPEPRRAIYWLNYLRWRYATGRWCLSLEPNELFVFRNSETRQIRDLIEFLKTEHRNHLYALVVEMYGEVPAVEVNLKPGDNPLDRLPYFDAHGYATSRPGRWRNVVVRGGIQRRMLFRDTPYRAPALNRTPLVKWRWYFGYVAGTRLMMPRRLNTPHTALHTSPTGCLLRFALLDGDATLTAAAKAELGQIVSDGGFGSYPGMPRLRRAQLKQELSQRFANSSDLVDCGLLSPGQWF